MNTSKLPPITLTTENYRVLAGMVDTTAMAAPYLSEFLSREIDRASVVKPKQIDSGVVTLGSSVMFRSSERTRAIQLVYPPEENILAGRLSILTPVGIALIGLSVDDEMEWSTRDGRTLGLKVLDVPYQPEAAAFGKGKRLALAR